MHSLIKQSVVVLGAGPTGLGAARRLVQIGDVDVRVFDENFHAGGLASSSVDKSGFTWDIGGHVQFSHYQYFDALMDELLGEAWVHHVREAWIWMRDRFIPYPLQNNIHLLPRDEFRKCLEGMIDSLKNRRASVRTFQEWIMASFGVGLAESFLLPYNFKVWAHEPGLMAWEWIGERVATADLARVIFNALDGTEDRSWGPNKTFRFPLHGGTGEVWRALAKTLPDGVYQPNKRCVRIDTTRRIVHFEDGSHERYERLVSTIPLDVLISLLDFDSLKAYVDEFRYSGVHVIGLGLKGAVPPHLKSKCWMYFPEANCPFYRATVFSNYSPYNVPDSSRYWSLMLEVSESVFKPVDPDSLLDCVVQGCIATKLIGSVNDIASTWTKSVTHGYPTPFVGRDSLVGPILKELEKLDIYSRGRFGGWKYEVSNQDHSLMQGVELVERLAFGTPEVTYWSPEVVNKPRT